MLLALAAQFDWQVHQMDVKSAFLNGDLQVEVYLQSRGFKQSKSDSNLYIKEYGEEVVIIVVDDLIITGSNLDLIQK